MSEHEIVSSAISASFAVRRFDLGILVLTNDEAAVRVFGAIMTAQEKYHFWLAVSISSTMACCESYHRYSDYQYRYSGREREISANEL